jgi:hypothetical protein
MGALSAIGAGLSSLRGAARAGRSGIGESALVLPVHNRVRVAEQVTDFDPAKFIDASRRRSAITSRN